jgi:hypothetical protein
MKTLKKLLIIATWILVIYIAFFIVLAEPRLLEWDQKDRFLFVWFSFWSTILTLIITYDE